MSERICSTEDLPQVGDIIQSEAFVTGAYHQATYEGPCGPIEPGGRTISRSVTRSVKERLIAAARTGDPDQPEHHEVDVRTTDPTRAQARYVVTRAQLAGGHCNPGGEDHPDGWLVHAHRLSDDGSLHPSDEQLEFYLTGWRPPLKPEDIRIVGRAVTNTGQG